MVMLHFNFFKNICSTVLSNPPATPSTEHHVLGSTKCLNGHFKTALIFIKLCENAT